MSYEEKKAEIEKRRAERAAERLARDTKELEGEVGDMLLSDEMVLVRFPEADVSLPGHYVGRRPRAPEIARFKSIMWRDNAQRGAIEAKANAGADLARQCRVYPSAERYDALVDAHAMVPDRVAQALIEAAQAGAEAEGKG